MSLPEITDFEVRSVAEWIQSHEQMQRRPDATAKVLILAVKLHKLKLPWPTRQAVADHLGVSKPLVDMVTSQRAATGHIELVLRARPGAVQKRESVVRDRFIIPRPDLVKVVEDAGLEEKRTRRRLRRPGLEIVAPLLALAFSTQRQCIFDQLLQLACHIKVF